MNQNDKTPQTSNPALDAKVKESIIVRGVCASIQNMSMPTFKNIEELFEKAGFKIVMQEIAK